jgi:restriction system protein
VLDLLPHNPRLALAAIDAYLTAHFMVLPDGRINGLDDAMSIIRARYIGRLATSEGKRQVFFELSPRDFERLVERLYQAMGYTTILTPPGRDGGRDVIASRVGAGQREQVQIECKMHTDPVGASTVDRLLGVVTRHKANKGVLVTSSRFTRDARSLADDNPRLDLISGVELVVLLNEYFGSEWPSRLDRVLREFAWQRDEANPDA